MVDKELRVRGVWEMSAEWEVEKKGRIELFRLKWLPKEDSRTLVQCPNLS